MRLRAEITMISLMGFIAYAAVVAVPHLAQAQQWITTIGTGGVTGVYYPTGAAICRLVNQGSHDHGVRCSAESTEGSVFNLNSIRAGELDFGVVQSDIQYHAYEGTDRFEAAGPYEDLRAVFSLHPEPFTIVARARSNIRTFEDLKGKRVAFQAPFGCQACARGDCRCENSCACSKDCCPKSMEGLLAIAGWSGSDFELFSDLPLAQAFESFVDARTDAIVLTVIHPSEWLQRVMSAGDAEIISVPRAEISELVRNVPYLAEATIPAGMYPQMTEDVLTCGPRATLVTSANVPVEVVYNLVKAVFENFDTFRDLYPALAVLEAKTMVEAGRTAPLHEGAARYFEEAGLM